MRRVCITVLLAAAIAGSLPGLVAWGQPAAQPAMPTRPLVVARVSDDIESALPKAQAFASYLAARVGAQHGIDGGRAVIVANNRQMIRMLREGLVDVVSETVMSALNFEEMAGAELLLREWKGGVAEYRSLVAVRAGSEIRTLADLRGRVIAFEDPGSTTGFLIPLALLRRRGIEANELSGPRQAPPRGKVGYLFTRAELNVAAMVARGVAHAGAMNNLDWNDVDRTPPQLKKELVVLSESEPLLRSILLVRGDLDPALKAAIRADLLQAHDDPQGKEALKTYFKVSRYDEIGPEAPGLVQARELYRFVRDRVE